VGLTIENAAPECLKEAFNGVLFCVWPMPPFSAMEFIEDDCWILELISVHNFQFKNAREKVFEIRFITPNEQGFTGVLLQVLETEFAKRCPVETLFIFWTVAARARVCIVVKRIGSECRVQVLYGDTELVGFFHTLILLT